MDDLVEETLGPDVVVRRANTTEIHVRSDGAAGQPLVGVVSGTVWARAEPASTGIDLGHGTINIVVREGTVLLDAQGGSGLVIVLRGAVEISSGGLPVAQGVAGDALAFDPSGRVGEPDPVDATELARDPFVSLNLVLDALGGAPLALAGDPSPQDATPTAAPGVVPERTRAKGLFTRGKR